MENVEFRSGQERFPEKDPRLNAVFLEQGQQLGMGEQRGGVDPYKLVEVQLAGGAPWGFTLKGGKEHGEPLIITKIEEGSKAAAVDKLLAGDEIVSINDIGLSGFRQEAICLVKGSHKMLKLVVKRKNDLACRPHSWHATKFTENQPESAMSRLSSTNVCASWHSRYHASSSSNDLTSSWDQSNLHRTSDQFSSAGSMDSWDHTPQMYQYGQISSAKSNSSIDHLGNPNKRDSAYGSFSTSSSTPDHTLSSADAPSAENVLYKMGNWETSKQGNGKTPTFLCDSGGFEEKPGCFPSLLQYDNIRSPQLEEHSDSKYPGAGRSNFGPVWYVPEKKKSPSPPPPPPPLRSDSFAATKGHERAQVPLYSEGIQSTQHFDILHRPQARNDWSTEPAEQQKRAIRVVERASDGRQGSNPTYRPDFSLDYGLPSASDRVNNNVGNANRLHSSLSSTDVRFAQSAYGHHRHHHQRQYSDESTFFHNAKVSASPKEQRQLSSYSGIQERPTDKHGCHPNRIPNSTAAVSSDNSSEEKMDNAGLSRYYCVAVKQSSQGNSRPLPFKDECRNPVIGSNASSGPPENPVVTTMIPNPKYYLPQQSGESSLDACEKNSPYVVNKGDGVRTPLMEDSRKISYSENPGKTKNFVENHSSSSEQECARECIISDGKTAQKDFKWGQEESHKISPQKTPMLHSLTQEGKSQTDVVTETGSNRQPAFDAHLSKNARRSDRFATTLRNEIQMRKAKMQKSKSTAAMAKSTEMEEYAENWKPDSAEKGNSSSESSFSNIYKDNLKEAQARVLKATSFQRRDLEPSLSEYLPDKKGNNYHSSLLVLASENESGLFEGMQASKQSSTGSNAHHVCRIGARKRFTAEEKLKSYSEPEKINEVGVSEDRYHPRRRPTISEEALGSFADRWKFFEETSKPTYQKPSQRHAPYGRPESHPSNPQINSHEGEPEGSWYERRNRAASFGVESTLCAHDRPKQSVHYGGHKTKSGQPQRLETFAEYQASWKEQKTSLEARSSGRYHSADNILDAGHEQLEKSQYAHERSRSSPSTDFYKQEVSTEVRRQTENSRDEEYSSLAARSDERNCSSRPADAGYPEGHSGEPTAQPDYNLGNKWKASPRPVHTEQPTVVTQKSRSRSGTLPSDYRYPQENVTENGKDCSVPPPAISELQISTENHFCPPPGKGEESLQTDPALLNKKHSTASQRPPPSKREHKYRRQDNTSVLLAASSESLLTGPSRSVPSVSPASANVVEVHLSPSQTLVKNSSKLVSAERPEPQQSASEENACQHLEGKPHLKTEPALSSTYCYLLKPEMENSRSPSPQFAPQKLTDKPPVPVQDENPTRIERVMDNNTTVKMVPIKIVHSESHAEKESRQNLVSTVEPPALPSGLEKDQIKTLSTSEQSYSRFCAYTRQGVELEPENKARLPCLQPVDALGTNSKDSDGSTHAVSYMRAKEKTIEDWKSEELAREIVDKDKSLADILDPNVKIKTTMDLMVGIFPKDDHLLEEAQQRRKLLLKVPSPKAAEDKKDEPTLPSAIPLTTNSTYYSTSAPKAELLIKMKDMQQQQQQQNEEDSEDELNHDLSEKKQELIDSISRKLQVLREARETLLEDIHGNNLLGEEVEAIVKEVCKPNEFDKFRMFIGDLDKVVNLLLSLSGRLARVENALNNLDENVSPEERRVLVEKQKLLTQQHEDAKELKENLDRRERIVFEILANYLSDESLADYEHFVKMKSALIIEQRELEDKIKLGEEQLKCLTESLQPERPK